MREAQVTVIGDLMLDRYWHCQAEKLNPEAPGVVFRYEAESLSLGGAAAVCEILHGLGLRVAAAGRVGNDQAGESLAGLVEKKCVAGLSVNRSGTTTVKQRVIAGGVLHHNRLDFEDVGGHPGDASALSGVAWAPVVLVSDYGKGFVSSETWRVLRDYCVGRFVIVDPAIGRELDNYAGASLVKMNAIEARELTGCGPHEAARELAKRYAVAVLVTDGPRGMHLCDGHLELYQPAAAARVFRDVTGCGDTVAAAIAAARVRGLNWQQTLEMAAKLAARQVEQLGVAAVGDCA